MPTFSGIVVATGGQAEQRRTLLDVVDELARPINAADSTVRALAGDAFRAAVNKFNRKGCWPWELLDEDVAITANERFSTVASAVKKPLTMHYLDAAAGTEDQRIDYVPYPVFRERYSLDVNSDPLFYTLPNLFETGQIRWHPIPVSNDNVRFAFYRVTPAPKAESETIEVPEYAIDAYMAEARYQLSIRLPAMSAIFPIPLAYADARMAFRELSAQVNAPGDRSRDIYG